MITEGLRLVLLLFALVGYAGAGASVAVARYRSVAEGERDLGILCVACMLFLFGLLCTVVGSGWIGVAAFGAVVFFASYLLTAQQMGLFRIDASEPPFTEEEPTKESRRAH